MQLIVVLVMIGLVLWLVGQLPIDPRMLRIIHVVVVVFVVLWLLQVFIGTIRIPIGR